MTGSGWPISTSIPPTPATMQYKVCANIPQMYKSIKIINLKRNSFLRVHEEGKNYIAERTTKHPSGRGSSPVPSRRGT